VVILDLIGCFVVGLALYVENVAIHLDVNETGAMASRLTGSCVERATLVARFVLGREIWEAGGLAKCKSKPLRSWHSGRKSFVLKANPVGRKTGSTVLVLGVFGLPASASQH
jgi:hypothetical protein